METAVKTTCRDLCEGKMYKALEAMLAGLEAAEQRDDFVIDMWSYGHVANEKRDWDEPYDDAAHDGKCHGCAATCALMQLTGKQFGADELPGYSGGARASWGRQAELCGLDQEDLEQFEMAIDQVRVGKLWPLQAYMHVSPVELEEALLGFGGTIGLPNCNWRNGEANMRALITELKAFDL